MIFDYILHYYLSTRCLTHMLSIEVDVCSVGVLEVLHYWTLQTSTSFTDKVDPSSILDYVTLCLTSIVVNKHTCVHVWEVCVYINETYSKEWSSWLTIHEWVGLYVGSLDVTICITHSTTSVILQGMDRKAAILICRRLKGIQ